MIKPSTSFRAPSGLVVLGLAMLWGVSQPAAAVGVVAGTEIQNTAQVSYTIGSTPVTTSSNTVAVTVAEVLDVVVTLQSATTTVSPGATNQVLVYRVTNTGNSSEGFQLTLNSVLGGDEFDPVPATPAIYFDTDGSGTLTPADTPYTPGANDPVLLQDTFVTVLVVNDIPTGLANGARGLSQLEADALTGTGAPGTVFAGQGANGTDAVVGTTGADGDATGQYVVADITLTAVKTSTVTDAFGGSRPIPGAQIRYQVVVTATGTGTAAGASFRDPIPTNTTFVPGSITLNGNAVTDSTADADAGGYTTSPVPAVQVALGDLTQASGPQTLVFDVTID
ncbi:MAG: hypothetical protein R3E65_12210 [Steroidobacteraceae bacterium]